jgi:signal recognition particle subunit SRP54
MLEKVTNTFSDIVRKIGGKSQITEKNIEDAVEEIKMALLEADVNLRVVRRFVNGTIEERRAKRSSAPSIPASNSSRSCTTAWSPCSATRTGPAPQGRTRSPSPLPWPSGSGKTTSAAKLAARLLKQGRKPVLAACDLVRPAAVEQLSVLGEKIGVPVYKESGATASDAVRVAKNALQLRRKRIRHADRRYGGPPQIDEP